MSTHDKPFFPIQTATVDALNCERFRNETVGGLSVYEHTAIQFFAAMLANPAYLNVFQVAQLAGEMLRELDEELAPKDPTPTPSEPKIVIAQ